MNTKLSNGKRERDGNRNGNSWKRSIQCGQGRNIDQAPWRLGQYCKDHLQDNISDEKFVLINWEVYFKISLVYYGRILGLYVSGISFLDHGN